MPHVVGSHHDVSRMYQSGEHRAVSVCSDGSAMRHYSGILVPDGELGPEVMLSGTVEMRMNGTSASSQPIAVRGFGIPDLS